MSHRLLQDIEFRWNLMLSAIPNKENMATGGCSVRTSKNNTKIINKDKVAERQIKI
jgi:hypothetical protein